MKKVLAIGMVVVILVTMVVVMAGCAPSSQKLEPCKVELVQVYPIFQGKESVSYESVFSISNPNAFIVTLDTFECTISVEGQVLAALQYADDVYIPGESKGRVRGAFTVPFMNLVVPALTGNGTLTKLLPEDLQKAIEAKALPTQQVQGLLQLAAMAKVLPMWKSLGGGLAIPSPEAKPLLEAVWESAPEKKPLFEAQGEGYLVSAGGSLEFEYKTKWQAE